MLFRGKPLCRARKVKHTTVHPEVFTCLSCVRGAGYRLRTTHKSEHAQLTEKAHEENLNLRQVSET